MSWIIARHTHVLATGAARLAKLRPCDDAADKPSDKYLQAKPAVEPGVALQQERGVKIVHCWTLHR